MTTITRQARHQRSDTQVEHHIAVDGVKLIRSTAGRYFAESKSRPGTLWLLTGFSCQCPGFIRHQRCRHHRALLSALGWTRGNPEPAPPVPSVSAECADCHGTGQTAGTVSTGRGWTYASVTCVACHGTGALVDTAA